MTPLELLARELQAESRNGMKRIRPDWNQIERDYLIYRAFKLTVQESFYSALLTADCDIDFTLEDLK